MHDNTPYMQWNIGHTIQYITPPQPSSSDDVSLIFNFYILFFFIPSKPTHSFALVRHTATTSTTTLP